MAGERDFAVQHREGSTIQRILGFDIVLVAASVGWAGDTSFLAQQRILVSSSCEACGKRSIAAVRVLGRYRIVPGEPRLEPDVVHGLPQELRAGLSGFARTGGIHASGLFDAYAFPNPSAGC